MDIAAEIEKLEIRKTDLIRTMEDVHQLDNKQATDPEVKFANQEVPKMQFTENLRMQLINVERQIKILNATL